MVFQLLCLDVGVYRLQHMLKRCLKQDIFSVEKRLDLRCEMMGSKSREAPIIYYGLANEQFTVQQLIDYGVAVEKAGFDGIWTSDHFQPWQPNEEHSGSAWTLLAALTQRTSRIHLGTGVTCPIFRYRPSIVAQVWASLSMLAPNRLFLGVGAGENLNEGAAGGGWTAYDERAARLIEAVKIIRELWKGNQVEFSGRFWSINGKLYDPPASSIPLYIAASGPKSARLSGLYGDGLITGAPLLKKCPELKAAWKKAIQEEGEDSRSKPMLVEHWAFVGDKKGAEEVAEKWRFAPKAWQPGFYDNISPRDIQARAEREIDMNKVIEDWTISKDPKDYVKDFKELTRLGATHILLHVGAADQLDTIECFGREVLPKLHES